MERLNCQALQVEQTHGGQLFLICQADTCKSDTETLLAIELMTRRIETLDGTLQLLEAAEVALKYSNGSGKNRVSIAL